MSAEKENISVPSEFEGQGVLTETGVKIADRSNIDALSQRGYGTAEKDALTLAFYEALFLVDKDILSVKDKKGETMEFQSLLKAYEAADENAWMHYLVYRDLRSRGYVVREGFGAAIDFRIYERGTYGKDAATSLVLSTQEGKPLPMEDLKNALARTQSLKKELVLAVMNRRGEIVYYSVSPLTFK
ncbi:MAG: tRNA-intron lyase [Candidatus Bathyarchaeota archaeon]|nr:tRNA-intron lyase [Candidatus Bathyarchaeota archaeon]